MSKKSNKYITAFVLVIFTLIITSLSVALVNTNRMQKQAEQNKVEQFKDKAEIISEVCVRGKHVVVFNVLQTYDPTIQVYVGQAVYKENFSVVLGSCNE